MRVYEQLAHGLDAAGVRSVFGVMGDGNMHWLAAYVELPGCRFRPAWHEAGAVWMADGYAVASDEVGVATVTMGPGLAQALAALTTVARTHHPVLLITAAIPPSDPPQAQEAEQEQWVQACGARYVAVHEPAGLDAALATSLAGARAGTATVLAVDVELFTATAHPDAVPAEEQLPALAADLDTAVRTLARAERPLVVLGGGVRRAGAVPLALEVGRRLGAAFASTLGGRTALPGEEFDLGLTGMMADPLSRQVAADADVLLVLGADLDRYNTDGAVLGRDATIVRIDLRAQDQTWSPSTDTVHVSGDLAAVLPRLLAQLPDARGGVRTDQLGRAIAAERERQHALRLQQFPDGANPWAMVAELDELLPSDAYLVIGIGHFWYFAAPYLRPAADRRFHFTSGFALIGQAMPVAVGAAAALRERGDGRTVVAVEGDGSLPMNVQELQAAVRHGADLLLLVLDNQAYGSEYHKLALSGLAVASSEFDHEPFPVCAVAEAMGATARTAGNLDQLRTALTELLPRAGVRVVDVRIARSPMSETYARQHAAPGSG